MIKQYKFYKTILNQNYLGKLAEVNKVLAQRKKDKSKVIMVDIIPEELYKKMKRFYPNNNLYYMDEDAEPYVYAKINKKFFLVEIGEN